MPSELTAFVLVRFSTHDCNKHEPHPESESGRYHPRCYSMFPRVIHSLPTPWQKLLHVDLSRRPEAILLVYQISQLHGMWRRSARRIDAASRWCRTERCQRGPMPRQVKQMPSPQPSEQPKLPDVPHFFRLAFFLRLPTAETRPPD